jgi:Plasmid encoded RepA protein
MQKSLISHAALDKLITEALAIEAEDATKAGALGFMARAMVQATLPHKKAIGNEFTRTNGSYSLTILAPTKIGLPYGSYPRLLLSWLTTEAVRTKERELVLGDSLSKFMAELGLMPTGGRWGSITQLKNQTKRLFSSHISCSYEGGESFNAINMVLADMVSLWWSPKEPEQSALWKSTVLLSQPFFNEITAHPVPIDLRALRALKRSPLALDIYMWLTYRMFYLSKSTTIPWTALAGQFGSGYAQTRQFKAAFLQELKKVLVVYPEAKVEDAAHGLMLLPSKPHVARLR